MNRLFLAVSLFAALSVPASAATLIRSYSYFTVRGNSLPEIEHQLHTQGPQIDGSVERHPGATNMEFTSKVRYREADGRCSVDDVQVTVRAHVILPRWRDWRRADQELRIIWDTLAGDIKRHEESHMSIAKNHARMLEDSLRALPRMRSCEDLADKVEIVTDRALARHDDEQNEFDRIETINFESRIERLLNYRLEQIEAGRIRY